MSDHEIERREAERLRQIDVADSYEKGRESVLAELLSDEAVDRASRVLEANVSSPFADCDPVARELLSALHSHLRGDG